MTAYIHLIYVILKNIIQKITHYIVLRIFELLLNILIRTSNFRQLIDWFSWNYYKSILLINTHTKIKLVPQYILDKNKVEVVNIVFYLLIFILFFIL